MGQDLHWKMSCRCPRVCSADTCLALSVQGSQDNNVSLVVNVDAARLGLADSRRIEIDVTAAARALGAAVGPQVAHLSAMMQQAAQAGQGAAGQGAAEGHPGAQPGARAAAGEVSTKCLTTRKGCVDGRLLQLGQIPGPAWRKGKQQVRRRHPAE